MSNQTLDQSAPPAPKKPKRWVPWVLTPLALFVGIGIGASGNSSGGGTPAAEPATTTVTKTAAATAKASAPKARATQAATSFPGDGTYLVPADIKPGTYRSGTPDSGECYWERLKSPDGGFESIIANDNSAGPTVVTIRGTDKAFKTQGCGTWTRVG